MALTTKDIGILIRDRIEDDFVIAHNWESDPVEVLETFDITFVDVSDANNPIVHTSNGQKFKIVVLAI